jgi:hypothetical protein
MHQMSITNMIPILMHQMRISTNAVSSVMLGLKKLEILKKCEICKNAGEKNLNQTVPGN